MTGLQGVHVACAAIYLWIAGYVLWRAPRRERSLGFSAIAACFMWWCATLVVAHDPETPRHLAAIAYDVGSLAWASSSSFALWFALAFSGKRWAAISIGWRAALIGPALLAIVAQWSGALHGDYIHTSWGWAYTWSATPWTVAFLAYYVGFTTLALAIVLRAGRQSTNRVVKRQAWIIVASGAVPFLCATITDVVLPCLGHHEIPNLAPVFLLMWTAGVTFAIARYSLLEVSPEATADEIAERALRAANDHLEARVAASTRMLRGLYAAVDAMHKATTTSEAASSVVRTLATAIACDGCRITLDGAVFSSDPCEPTATAATVEIVAAGVRRGVIEVFCPTLPDEDRELVERVALELGQTIAAHALERAVAQSDRLASVGVLAAGVAHEINNPLTFVILGLHEIELALAASKDASVASLHERAKQALLGADRIAKIVKELGSYARDGSDERDVPIRDPIAAALAMSAHQIQHRSQIAVSHASRARVHVDPSRLTQVFLNLLVNAVQAMPGGDIDRNVIGVRTFDEGERAIVEIRDNGRGIEPADLPRIFDMFFTTKPVGHGNGIGLAVCHKIVRAAGGEIEVASKPGEGTTFRVSLPRASSTRGSVDRPAPVVEVKPPVLGRVLVIDDDELVASAISRMVSHHEVMIVHSGAAARKLLDEDARFDVVLCDMMMPDMTGPDLYAWIGEHHPALAARILFMTGGAFTNAAETFREQHADRVIMKPFEPTGLRNAIDDAVATARRS